jgi:hypothetical protein
MCFGAYYEPFKILDRRRQWSEDKAELNSSHTSVMHLDLIEHLRTQNSDVMTSDILSPTDSPKQRKMSSDDDDDDEYPEELSYRQELPAAPPTQARLRRESQGDWGVLMAPVEFNPRVPPRRTSRGDFGIHPPGAAFPSSESSSSSSKQQQYFRPSRKISQGDIEVNDSELTSSPPDSRRFPPSCRASQGAVEQLAGSNSHSPLYQRRRDRISLGDVKIQQLDRISLDAVQIQQTESSLLSSRRVAFSTVHIRTHGIEYDHGQYDKKYPLSLGWDILGEDYFALGHHDDNELKPAVKSRKRLSIQKRRNRLLGMGYTEMDLSEAETERGKVQSTMPPSDISLAEPIRITRPTADLDDEGDTSTSTISALGRRIGAAAFHREQSTRHTTDSDDEAEDNSDARVKRSVGETMSMMDPVRITRPAPDLDDEVEGGAALTPTRKLSLESERITVITRPSPDTDNDC